MPCLQWELFAPSQSLEAVVFGSGRYNGGGSTFSASILGPLGKPLGKPWRNGGLNRLNHVAPWRCEDLPRKTGYGFVVQLAPNYVASLLWILSFDLPISSDSGGVDLGWNASDWSLTEES